MSKMNPKISVLIASRKNSKYLAKFLMGLYNNTGDIDNLEILCMAHADDTWNIDTFAFFTEEVMPEVKFRFERTGLGRGGLHEYFNELYKEATGDWIVYFCDDHYINTPDWDLKVYQLIRDHQLEAKKIYCLIPKFDNVGAMNQILSRGYIQAMGGYLGRHGNIDSYINDVNHLAFGAQSERPNNKDGDRIIRFNDEMFHDFTHDKPDMMDPYWSKTPLSSRGKMLPKYNTPEVLEMIGEDAAKLKNKIDEGL